jgi:NADPH:quinone reductase and related Zn-dependent oxidoreductases
MTKCTIQMSGSACTCDEDVPHPRGEVLVRIHTAGLNRAEWLFMHGQYLVTAKNCARGVEGAGVIEAVGEGVEGYSIGQELCITLTCP